MTEPSDPKGKGVPVKSGEERHLTDGEVAIVARLREGLARIKAMPCPDCRGSGDGRWQDDYCLRCGGSGEMVPIEEATDG